MKKTLFALFGIAALFTLITLALPIKGNPIIETTTVSIQQEIVYAYVTTEMLTNGYGVYMVTKIIYATEFRTEITSSIRKTVWI